MLGEASAGGIPVAHKPPDFLGALISLKGDYMAKGKYQQWLEPDGLILLEGWARDGLTDEQIAKKIGVNARTLYEWKDKYQQISQALKKGKEVIDIQVENALLKRALGYQYEEVKTEVADDGGTKVTRTIKEVIPDTTAQIFWLKNRRPDKWRQKPEAVEPETVEDDGLLSALDAKVEELQDDVDMLPEETE